LVREMGYSINHYTIIDGRIPLNKKFTLIRSELFVDHHSALMVSLLLLVDVA